MKKSRTLIELFSFPGFIANNQLEGKFGDPKIRIIELKRKKNRLYVLYVASYHIVITIKRSAMHVIVTREAIKSICGLRDEESSARNAAGFIWKH
jgi:hypothetical protein